MTPKKKGLAIYGIIGLVLGWVGLCICIKTGNYMSLNPDVGVFEAMTVVMDANVISPVGLFPLSEQGRTGLLAFFGIATIAILSLVIEIDKNKRTAPGIESGSASWNERLRDYRKRYVDVIKKGATDTNMILSQNVKLSMNTRKTGLNNNCMVVGGAGSGKSRGLVKPNILQANCNYVVTDPAGDICRSTGKKMEKDGYNIKIFNLVEMSKSNRYNPFHYIRNDLGVLMMINCLISNTTPSGQRTSDPFWEKSETALLQALCFYLINEQDDPSKRNFSEVMKLLRLAEVDENNPNKKSALDEKFEAVAERDENSIALKQYRIFKQGAGKTLKSILISCSVRLAAFNLDNVAALTNEDDIHLEELGADQKTILYVIIPAADTTYNFLVSMMYSQLFETLYYNCETKNPGAFTPCPRHVRFMLDEFVNIGQIPNFPNRLTTMRKYEISCTIIIQNIGQIKALYEDDWETLMGNCSSFVYLGGQEYSTAEYVSNALGDTTVVVRNNSRTRGKNGSSQLSYNRSGRKLMFPNEILAMNYRNCIVLIQGIKPFFGPKSNYVRHPAYKETGDASPQNAYINTIDNTLPAVVLTSSTTVDDTLPHKEVLPSKDVDKIPLPLTTSKAPLSAPLTVEQLAEIHKSSSINVYNRVKAVENVHNEINELFREFDVIADDDRTVVDVAVISEPIQVVTAKNPPKELPVEIEDDNCPLSFGAMENMRTATDGGETMVTQTPSGEIEMIWV